MMLASSGRESGVGGAGGGLGVRSGGVLTPATALGGALLPKLESHGISFEVDGDTPRGVWFSF